MKRQGRFHIEWLNHAAPTITPRYKLSFMLQEPGDGGALRPKDIAGKSDLQAYLVKVSFTPASATSWVEELHATGKTSVDLPHELDEEEYYTSYVSLPTSA